MCGIAGIYSKFKIDKVQVVRMTDAIAHRGPDGAGLWMNDAGNLGLGHRRLSIIDLSDNATQPMHYQDRYVITFNGEIYNYLELKKELIADGFSFNSSSDTEVLIALYAKYKERCLEKLDGMFAFVIYDKQEKKLFGGRDRFGEKPFYYHLDDNKNFVFASELKALFAYGISKTVNREMLANFLLSNYAISNPQSLEQTFYEKIYKLPAASYFTIDDNFNLGIKNYWSIDINATNDKINFNEACEEFRFLFNTSVMNRMRSDVPIGSSLSGGLDSSSIVSTISHQHINHTINQNTFSARFANFEKDEGKYIQYILDQTKCHSHFTWPDGEGFERDFNDLLYFQDEPFPSASIYAQYCVMKKAKEQGVIVLLDGQGADEILAGYEYYLQTYLNQLSFSNSNQLQTEYNYISSQHQNYNFVLPTQSQLADPRISLKDLVKGSLRPIYKLVNPNKYKHLSTVDSKLSLLTADFLERLGTEWKYKYLYNHENVKNHLWYSVKQHNLEDLLRFSDRNAMAHSREVRLPFLNANLVEFIFTLPIEFLIQKGWTKYILRASMESILPSEIAWRKDKIGYEPPQKKWLETFNFQNRIEVNKQFLIKEGYINKAYHFSEDHNWSILMSEILLR